MRSLTILPCTLAALAVIAESGCGGPPPSSPAIVTVGSSVITKARFERAMKPFTTPVRPSPTPEAPVTRHVTCDRTPQAGLDRKCRDELKQIKISVLEQLITARWLETAVRQGTLSINDSAVDASVRQQLQMMHDDRTLATLQRRLGITAQVIRSGVRYESLREALRRKVRTDARPVSANQVTAYYEAHRALFRSQPIPQPRHAIRTFLRQRHQAEVLKVFTDTYRAHTVCEPAYRIPHCNNGPAQRDDVTITAAGDLDSTPRNTEDLRIYRERVPGSSGTDTRKHGSLNTGTPELVVYVPSELTRPSRTPRTYRIRFACFDARGKRILRSISLWPWSGGETGGAGLEPHWPHFHQRVADDRTLMTIQRCQVSGTPEPLMGSVPHEPIRVTHPPYPWVNPASEGLV